MLDAAEFAARAADDWAVVCEVMRELNEDDEWPAGFGDMTVHPHPQDGTPVFAVGDGTYAVFDPYVTVTRPDRQLLVHVANRTVKEVPVSNPSMN